MSLSAKIREQIISSFRAELAEHLQTLNDGLLSLEKNQVTGDARTELLGNVFRAAHSLKGAARAVGVGTIEQLAHALEDILGAMQADTITSSPEMYTACYQSLDAIQLVQAAYEAGETTPPASALTALVGLEPFRHPSKAAAPEKTAPASVDAKTRAKNGPRKLGEILQEAHDETTETAPEAAAVEPQQAARPAAPAPGQPAPVTDETIRVSISKLDALMARLSELLVTKIHAEQRLSQVRATQEFMADWQKEWGVIRGVYSGLARRGLDELFIGGDETHLAAAKRKELRRVLEYVGYTQDRMRTMSAMVAGLVREYANDTMQLSLVIDGLEEEIKRVRMLPFSTITGSLARMVRDLAHSSGKDAMLQVIGGDVELDKRVLEQIKDPIIHLLRNAVDHGIESSAERASHGKPPYGTITLAVEQIGKDVSITIADDGSGIDIDAIRRAAVKRGNAAAASMTDQEAVQLIYNTGFSTSPIITDLSGRGVGLDIVRRNVEALHGTISLDWKTGLGSRFTLLLPLALTSSRALTVFAAGQPFAIPLNAIQRILYVAPGDISSVGGSETLKFDGHPITLVSLSDVLGLPHTETSMESGRMPVVILASADRLMAFAVDALGAEQEVVIKGLGRQLTRVAGFSGASVMGNGNVLLILNVADLMKIAQNEKRRSVLEAPAEQQANQMHDQKHILVVDDSITTRTLEKNILEAAGYSVRLANDGQEAFNVLMSNELPHLVISDVQMPKMNGIELATRIKNTQRTSHLPVILVTSLDSVEDKARGVEAGADAYIVKSAFDQNNLLETIQQLI